MKKERRKDKKRQRKEKEKKKKKLERIKSKQEKDRKQERYCLWCDKCNTSLKLYQNTPKIINVTKNGFKL